MQLEHYLWMDTTRDGEIKCACRGKEEIFSLSSSGKVFVIV